MRQWRSRSLSGLALVVALVAVLAVPLAVSGCRTGGAATNADLGQEVDRFLSSYGLAVTGEPLRTIEMRNPSAPGGELTAIGDRTEVEMAVALEIATREAAFGPGQRPTTWFTVAEKTSLGWKLSGFGTGP